MPVSGLKAKKAIINKLCVSWLGTGRIDILVKYLSSLRPL